MEPAFVVFRSSDRAANDRHFHACQEEGRPMVMVKLGRKYATLEWDCITLDPTNEPHVRDRRGDLLMRGMYDRFCALAERDPSAPIFYGTAFCGTVSRLLPDTARSLAAEYFQLLRADGPAHVAAQL